MPADALEPLTTDDLETYAEAAQVAGQGEPAIDVLRRAFDGRIEADQPVDAARLAFWQWQALVLNNEFVRAGGWIQQAQREIGAIEAASVWFAVPQAYGLVGSGELSRASQMLGEAIAAARRHDEPEVMCWAVCIWVASWFSTVSCRMA